MTCRRWPESVAWRVLAEWLSGLGENQASVSGRGIGGAMALAGAAGAASGGVPLRHACACLVRHHTPAKNGAQQLRECLRVKGVATLLACGISSVWKLVNADPTFPKPIKLSPKVTVWRLTELEAWIESRRVKGGTA